MMLYPGRLFLAGGWRCGQGSVEIEVGVGWRI